MVSLTRIYTRTGDDGQTRLADNSIADKTDPRVEAYGGVDEANCVIALALSAGDISGQPYRVLAIIQNELFDVGADLATPMVSDPPYPPLRITAESVDRLEGWCDEFNHDLPALRSFVLPGGCQAATHLNLARAIVRRAERAAWAAAERYGLADESSERDGGVNRVSMRYLNRLSDLLFIMARYLNHIMGVEETLWVPGGADPR